MRHLLLSKSSCFFPTMTLLTTRISVFNQTIYFITNLSTTADEPFAINSTDHKLIHHRSYLKTEQSQMSLFFSSDTAMILNISQLSQFQYQNCDHCKIVLWCATVFHNCHSLVERSEARIVENWMKCHNFVQNRY